MFRDKVSITRIQKTQQSTTSHSLFSSLPAVLSSRTSKKQQQNTMMKPSASAVLVPLLVFLTKRPVVAHLDGGYLHDSEIDYDMPMWMNAVSDSKRISELSIPGTHNTMTYENDDLTHFVNCQTLELKTQLNGGIRFLDIRARHVNDRFTMHHGSFYLEKNLDDVLQDVTSFLNQRPSETVVIRLKDEYDPSGNTRSYAATFDWYMTKENGAYGNFVWTGGSNPTLGDARGKIIFIQNFSGSSIYTALDWSSLNKQDNYNLGTNWNLYDKWQDVKDHIDDSKSGDSNTLYVNFLSGSGTTSTPYFVASGHASRCTSCSRLKTGYAQWPWGTNKKKWVDFPRVNCRWGVCSISFEGTNTLAKNLLKNGSSGRVGIVVADFPGWELIDAVIRQNDFISVDY